MYRKTRALTLAVLKVACSMSEDGGSEVLRNMNVETKQVSK